MIRDYQDSPLLCAVTKGDLAIVEALLEHGANDNMTPLMLAASRGHQTIVEALLYAGADPHLRDKAGRNSAEVALEQRYTDLHGILVHRMKSPAAEAPQSATE